MNITANLNTNFNPYATQLAQETTPAETTAANPLDPVDTVEISGKEENTRGPIGRPYGDLPLPYLP